MPGTSPAGGWHATYAFRKCRSLPCGKGGSWPANGGSGLTAAAAREAWPLVTHCNIGIHNIASRGMFHGTHKHVQRFFTKSIKCWHLNRFHIEFGLGLGYRHMSIVLIIDTYLAMPCTTLVSPGKCLAHVSSTTRLLFTGGGPLHCQVEHHVR